MTSQAKSESARANGAKSRGPKTDAGKQRSSQNAIKHGLTAQTLVLPCEDPADYQRLLDSYHQQFRPDGPVENDLVREMVAARWRLNRLELIETQLLADSIIDVEQRHEDWASDDDQPLTAVQALAKGFQRMSASSAFLYRIQSRLEHAYSRALRALLQLQKLRGPSQPPAGPDAGGKIENCTNEPTAWRTHSCVPCSHSCEHNDGSCKQSPCRSSRPAPQPTTPRPCYNPDLCSLV